MTQRRRIRTEYMKEWRSKNAARLADYSKRNFEKWVNIPGNRDRIRSINKKYTQTHSEENKLRCKKWHYNNPEKVLKNSLKKKGLTLESYRSMLESQDGKCAICRGVELTKLHKRLHIDHDHITGRVRGLLCHNCNLTLGRMKENSDNLRAAAEYLDSFKVLDALENVS